MSVAPALREPASAAGPPVVDAAGFAAHVGASPEQLADLARLHAMLTDWNQRINLVGPASLAEFWPRHAFDSAQLLRVAPNARIWVDIGAGAGFPGLVLAILLKGDAQARVHLVESIAKKCSFLTAVATALELPAEVHNARAETLALAADVVTARAVAPLGKLLGFAQPYLSRGAVGLFHKGRGAEVELAEARKAWRFTCNIIPSLSDPDGRVLRVGGLTRAR